jgi:hypothetical protein
MIRPEAIEAIVLATSTNETKAKGRVRKVTFEIPTEGPNPFEGLGGERIHIVVVRLNNDETPSEELKKEPVEGRRFHQMPAASQIAMACQTGTFREYIRLMHYANLEDSAEACDRWIKRHLGIESKREVTAGSETFAEWTMLYGNYLTWLKYERAD